ncbi:MAG TPA: hypothetical protein VNZ86_11170, partial [Bacteroidia bacterium]|nr:hypothetical protein [Bacteroidia bacterium]
MTGFCLFVTSVKMLACHCPEEHKELTLETCKAYPVIFVGKVDSLTICDKGYSLAWFHIDTLYKGNS